ncbi:hypothetical protein F2Q68_00030327 [Brassica cretica]|uniref:Uncharacterized protein n=1 Tax=Brassica cretica TaxID=69181 RepID=A0A8S9GE62_BRACR|nr:hypothetical protein F2Q68_00030327 [Brassica cretica]
MHGFVSYRRFWRVRSLRNGQTAYVPGRYVATEPRSCSAAFVLGSVHARSLRSDRAWLVCGLIAILDLVCGRFG